MAGHLWAATCGRPDGTVHEETSMRKRGYEDRGQGAGPWGLSPGLGGFRLSWKITRDFDRRIRRLAQPLSASSGGSWSLAAVGGYGRRELCPGSDLDLLVFTSGSTSAPVIEELIRTVIYPLWDMGHTTGYVVKTASEVTPHARSDLHFFTSVMDARYLSGDISLFEDATRSTTRVTSPEEAMRLVAFLGEHARSRHAKNDGFPLHEPDVKDGPGGLRDYHGVVWALGTIRFLACRTRRMRLTRGEKARVVMAADRLLLVRHHLHRMAGNKTDRLLMEHHTELARRLGYTDGFPDTAEESLLKDVTSTMNDILLTSASFLSRIVSELGMAVREAPAGRAGRDLARMETPFGLKVEAEGAASGDPSDEGRGKKNTKNGPDGGKDGVPDAAGGRKEGKRPRPAHPATAGDVLEVFLRVSMTGLAPSAAEKDAAERSMHLLDNPPGDTSISRPFLDTLTGPYPAEALLAMVETGALERVIPGFKAIRGRVPPDPIHRRSVDMHSIETVKELKALESCKKAVFSLVDDTECLYLSALLHDIGKGYGTPHSVTGSSLAGKTAMALGLGRDRADRVAHLVRFHLLLPDTVSRRDLSEEKTILDVARAVMNPGNLAMLYLLCIADSRATSPVSWDPWKESLLGELYEKTLHVLEKGTYRDLKKTALLERRWSRLASGKHGLPAGHVEGRLWSLPQSYVIHTPLSRIVRHLRLARGISSRSDVALDVETRADRADVTVVARDRHGLFATLTGIFALFHLEILSAKVFTWYDNTAVDTFHVRLPWSGYDEWDRLEAALRAAMEGVIDVEASLGAKRPLATFPRPQPRWRAHVLVDNSSSDFFTTIEVRALSGISTVYRVSRAITALGLNIHRAVLSIQGSLRLDTFSVVDATGEKVTDEVTVERTVRVIEEAAEGG